jgi:hypothetical protein
VLNDKNSISRRSVVKAAAWVTPAIAFAVAAPNASASPTGSNTDVSGDGRVRRSAAVGSFPYDYGNKADIAKQAAIVINDDGLGWNSGQVIMIFSYTGSDSAPVFKIMKSNTSFATGVDSIAAVNDSLYAWDGSHWKVLAIGAKFITLALDAGFQVTGGAPDQYFYLPHVKATYTSGTSTLISATVSVGDFEVSFSAGLSGG